MFKISPLRIPVSSARIIIRHSSPFDADNSLFSSLVSSLRVRAFAVRGIDIAVTGFVLTKSDLREIFSEGSGLVNLPLVTLVARYYL